LSSVPSKYLQVFNAKQFKESVTEPQPSNVYLTFGRSYAWSAVDDATPQDPSTSVWSYNDIWNNMIGGRKLSGNDIRHVIPRFNWAANTVFNQYDDLIDSRVLKSETNDFYVVTEDWNVYKCISNNYGAVSTTKPLTISTLTDVQLEDGYIWKYMYTITSEEQLRFVTDDYIPVKTLSVNDGSLQWQVQNNAISGGIHNILLTNFGSGYTSNTITISISGDGQDAAGFAVRNTVSNTVGSIVVTNKGINYTYANVTISSNTGNGAVARAIISPPGGHGYDPIVELGGSNLLINTQIKGTENGKLPATNDFRQIALIEDPITFTSSYPIANSVVSQLTEVTLNGTSVDYIHDETVYQGTSLATATFSGNVVEWDSANNRLKLSNTKGIPGSDLVIGIQSTAARFLSSITNPDMKRYTGNLLYIDNISPIQRAADQVDDFQIIIKF
jgi:hypothetical protein